MESHGQTWRNGFEVKEGRHGLGISKKFFSMRVVRPWNRLPEKLWMLHLEVFKARSDGALDSLIKWVVTG